MLLKKREIFCTPFLQICECFVTKLRMENKRAKKTSLNQVDCLEFEGLWRIDQNFRNEDGLYEMQPFNMSR